MDKSFGFGLHWVWGFCFVLFFSHSPSLEILLISSYNSSKLCLQHEQHETYSVTVESSKGSSDQRLYSCLPQPVHNLPFKQHHIIDPYPDFDLLYLLGLFPEKHPTGTLAFQLIQSCFFLAKCHTYWFSCISQMLCLTHCIQFYF